MPDPSSFMVGNAPQGASYAAPLVGFGIGDRLGKLPEEYAAGQQRARTNALQNAFPNGLPRDASGNVDVNAVGNTLVKLGGAEYAQQMMPFLMNQQIGAQAAQGLNGVERNLNGGGNTPAPASATPSASMPQKPQPVSSTASTSAAGPANITGDFPKPKQPRQAQSQPEGSAPAAAPAIASGAAPPQVQGPGGPAQGAPMGTGAAGIPYAQYPGMMDRLARAAQQTRAIAAQVAAVKPDVAKQYEAQAADYDARRKQLFEEYQKVLEPTQAQKDLASGATQRGEELKGEVARGDKMYGGITAAASQYERDLKPYIDISRAVLNDPSMYTGSGSNISLNVNRIRAAFGDQAPAMMQAALQKVTASNVLGQINQQKDQMQEAGGTSSRIFAQQVSLVEKAAPSLENTLGGNRFLINVSQRMGDLSSKVAEMARDYISNPAHRHLDAGFDKQLADYMKQNPIFSKEELSHPTILGAPTIPPALQTKQQVAAWARSMGVKPEDALRTPDGRYVPASAFVAPQQSAPDARAVRAGQ